MIGVLIVMLIALCLAVNNMHQAPCPTPNPVAPQSNCYVPGEAHNELTLPCVTIEP